MGTLTSKLVISLVDQVSGPAGRLTASLQGIERTTANLRRSYDQSMTAFKSISQPVLDGMHKAEEFNKAVFGVGVAALADNTREIVDATTGLKTVVTDFASVNKVMREFEDSSMAIAKDLGLTPSRIASIGEVLAKAGFGSDKLAAASRAVAQAALTDTETPAKKLGEFASVLDTIYKPREGEAWGDFFKRQLNIVMVAADETRLSLGSTMEGMRAFSALYAGAGNSENTNALLLMAGVKKGGEATEVGHTLKSDLVRFMRMTQEGNSTMSALGLRRGDYTDLSAMDPMRTVGNLARVFRTARIQKGFRAELESMFQRAMENGTFGSDEFHDKIMRRIAKAGGYDMKNENSRTLFEEKYNNAVYASGLRVDMLRLFQDLMAKGATPAQLATIFEGRRIGTNTQIFEGLREFTEEYSKKLGMATGQGLDATQRVHDGSAIGRMRKYEALIENFQIRLANSKGFETVLNGLIKLMDTVATMPPGLLETGVALAMINNVVGGVATGLLSLGMALMSLRWMAGLAGFGGVAAGAGAGAAGNASGRMIAGMSAAAAGATGAAAGGGLMSRLGGGMRAGGKLIGRLFWPLALGLAAYGALDAGREAANRGEGWLDILKHGAAGAVGLDGFLAPPKTIAPGLASLHETMAQRRAAATISAAGHHVAQGGTSVPAAGGAQVGAQELGGVEAKASGTVSAIRSAMDQVRAIVGAVDLTSEGQRIAQSLANGIRSGIGDISAAASEAANAAARGAVRDAYSDGGLR